MLKFSMQPYLWMSSLIALCLAIAATAGLLNPEMYTPFIRSEALRVGLPVQDFVSLLAAPGIIAAMFYAKRGSARALVIWTGLLLFAGYYYAFYCFGYVYTIYYPLYLAIMGLSVYALAGLLASVNLNAFRECVGGGMPVRFLAFVMGMTLLFIPLWLMAIYQGIQNQQVDAAALVFVLDLAFLIPASAFGAVQLWRRRTFGFLIGGILIVKLAISGVLLTGGSLVQIARGFAVGPDMGMYIFLLVAGTAGLWLYLRNIHAQPVPEQNINRGVRAGIR
jgi:hypothetical protein